MDTNPTTTTTNSPTPPAAESAASSRRLRWFPASPEGWAMFALGFALLAYGTYQIGLNLVRTGKGSLFGLILVFGGVALLPYRLVGLICGVALVAIGVYMLIANFNTLQALMVLAFGILTVMERVRRPAA